MSEAVAVMVNEDIGWGYETFTYSRADVRRIADLLNCNGKDIVRVFDTLWREGTIVNRQPNLSLYLIQRVAKAMESPRDPGDVVSMFL